MKQNSKTSKELPLSIHDTKNDLNYILHGDYYLPNIEVESGNPLGKYGRARLRYLQEHRSNVYTRLLLSGKLYDDLNKTKAAARHLLETTIPIMANAAGITETLKAIDPMKWVGMMNAIKDQVEEIIWNIMSVPSSVDPESS
ncbi:MAG: TnpV protein [Clostridia bacterium]|nr:TnpV protein [Clostridia bacterium]